MAEETKLILSDPALKPDDALLEKITGNKWHLWQDIMTYCTSEHEGSSGEWNFYNDGKRWLYKMTRKKKTLFWSGMTSDGFVVTFYFGDKAESVIYESNVSQVVKDRFKNSKRFGSLRAITFNMNDPGDREDIKKLIDIKVKLK